MNYKRIYTEIINNAKNRPRPNCYCENHHIIPKSHGGSDDKDNIVALTAREHFIAHWLLMKMHKDGKMIMAFFYMTKPVGNGRTRYTSHSFKYAREAASSLMKERTGEKHPMYGVKGKDNPNYGSKRTKETRKKLSEKAKERFKNNPNPKAKKVICLETGEIFKSALEAQRNFSGNVKYAIRTGGTASGLHFKYVGDESYSKKKNNYATGSRVHGSKPVIDEFGSEFETLSDAGRSVGATGSAISWGIKNKKPTKGVRFYYV